MFVYRDFCEELIYESWPWWFIFDAPFQSHTWKKSSSSPDVVHRTTNISARSHEFKLYVVFSFILVDSKQNFSKLKHLTDQQNNRTYGLCSRRVNLCLVCALFMEQSFKLGVANTLYLLFKCLSSLTLIDPPKSWKQINKADRKIKARIGWNFRAGKQRVEVNLGGSDCGLQKWKYFVFIFILVYFCTFPTIGCWFMNLA